MYMQDFDVLERMIIAYENAASMEQYESAANLLYQINEELPEDLQLELEDVDDPEDAKKLCRYQNRIRHAVNQHKERLLFDS